MKKNLLLSIVLWMISAAAAYGGWWEDVDWDGRAEWLEWFQPPPAAPTTDQIDLEHGTFEFFADVGEQFSVLAHDGAWQNVSPAVQGQGSTVFLELCLPGPYLAYSFALSRHPGQDVSNPFASVDENGMGYVEPFRFEPVNGEFSVPPHFEWLGIAVGIFVEPVDWVMTAIEIYKDPTNPWAYVGMIPGVPSGAGRLAKKALAVAADTVVRTLPNGIVMKAGNAHFGLEHIIRRHHHRSTATNAGKFAEGMEQNEIIDAVSEALANSTPSINGSIHVYTHNLNRVIGKDINGQPATSIKVVVDASRNPPGVTTAYPVN